jgi:multidrug efflux pump subunit AcrA (membrane-fusion protein)
MRPESGMFVRVRLPIGKQQILAVPASAIVERGQLTGIFVVDDSNVIRLRLIRTGERRGDLVEVLSGLAPGDHAIFVRDSSVKDGARWKP